MSRCTDCGLVIRNPQPVAHKLDQLYEESWVDPEANVIETGATDSGLAHLYMKRLLHSLGLTSFSGLTILDFGAGRGATVEALSSLGANVVAVEPFGHTYLQKRGIPAYPTLDDVPGDLRFDGIVSIDVVEHLTVPLETMTQLKNLLSDQGWLFLATPNAGGINSRLKRAAWSEVLNPGHLFLFAPNNLDLLLAKTGFPRRQRLRWYVRYSDNLAKRVLHLVLQTAAVDGELRYLAYKG
jgi:2-polyprenyl-3-methyl-5-hydroxy-6-metoxy-1,4-benzoquinol methylase